MLTLLLACQEPVDTGGKLITPETGDTGGEDTDTGEVIEDLGDPYLGMVAHVPVGFLAVDCVMRLELYSGETSLGILEIDPAQGGEWVGMDLEGGTQYKVVAYHSQCTDQTPEETIESGAFSGIAGLLFLYRFNGTNGGMESLEQTIDYAGGTAYITLVPGTPPDAISAVATTLGASISAGSEADTWVASFPTDVPVGRVIAEMAKTEGFLEAAPEWIDKPAWW